MLQMHCGIPAGLISGSRHLKSMLWKQYLPMMR